MKTTQMLVSAVVASLPLATMGFAASATTHPEISPAGKTRRRRPWTRDARR